MSCVVDVYADCLTLDYAGNEVIKVMQQLTYNPDRTVASYETAGWSVAETSGCNTVRLRFVRGNGSEHRLSYCKDADGHWKLYSNRVQPPLWQVIALKFLTGFAVGSLLCFLGFLLLLLFKG